MSGLAIIVSRTQVSIRLVLWSAYLIRVMWPNPRARTQHEYPCLASFLPISFFFFFFVFNETVETAVLGYQSSISQPSFAFVAGSSCEPSSEC